MSTGIKPIGQGSIHRLTSGQVIVDLASAVKELVENSLDAGASSIEVRFKNYGLDEIEVIDNGKGIQGEDFKLIGLKHYTSKLVEFEDLERVSTFGFRGEAINSLCGVSNHVVIITCTENDKGLATRLELANDGSVLNQTRQSGKCGTHIIISNLFKDRLAVRRKDFEKNYKREFNRAIGLLEQYAVICENTRILVNNQSTRKAILIQTLPPPSTVKQNIINVFGISAATNLEELDLNVGPTHIVGFITKPSSNTNGNDSNRQLVYINGRPCQLSSMTRVINQVYKSYNHQKPFLVANLLMDPSCYDVNVTPDKRTILIHNERQFLEQLGNELQDKLSKDNSREIPISIQKLSQSSPVVDEEELEIEIGSQMISPKRMKFVKGVMPRRDIANKRSSVIRDFVQEEEENEVQDEEGNESEEEDVQGENQREEKNEDEEAEQEEEQSLQDLGKEQLEEEEEEEESEVVVQDSQNSDTPTQTKVPSSRISLSQSNNVLLNWVCKINQVEDEIKEYSKRYKKPKKPGCIEKTKSLRENGEEALSMNIKKGDFAKMKIIGQFNRGFILARLDKGEKSNVFIIDQHASDEKYNFERIQDTTVIRGQRLAVYQTLKLTPLEKLIVLDNLNILKLNGFEIIQNDDDGELKLSTLPEIGGKKYLNVNDLYELIYQLNETQNDDKNIKCSKLQSIFASQACRQSIMIGKCLNNNQMTVILNHLGQLDKPWNCPHGRPTMRHLADISNLV